MKALNSWRKRHFLGSDAIIALIIASVIIALTYATEIGVSAYDHVEQNLLIAYRTTATISGSLMGLSITVTVLAINFWQGQWFGLIKKNDKAAYEIWATLKQTTWCLGLLTATALFAIVATGGIAPEKWTIIPYIIILFLTIARLLRAIAIIHRMIDIAVEASRNN